LLPDASSALLEYVVSDDETFLFVVTKGRKDVDVRVYTLPVKRDELAKQTEAFAGSLPNAILVSARGSKTLRSTSAQTG
jgi:hypothetical protein